MLSYADDPLRESIFYIGPIATRKAIGHLIAKYAEHLDFLQFQHDLHTSEFAEGPKRQGTYTTLYKLVSLWPKENCNVLTRTLSYEAFRGFLHPRPKQRNINV